MGQELRKKKDGGDHYAKENQITHFTLAVFGLLAGGLAAYGSVSAGGTAAVSGTSSVFDLQDHGGVSVMNPQDRGTSDLVRTIDGNPPVHFRVIEEEANKNGCAKNPKRSQC